MQAMLSNSTSTFAQEHERDDLPNPSASKAKSDLPNFPFLKNIYSKRRRNVRFTSCYVQAGLRPGRVIADSSIFSPQNEPGQGCT